MKKILYFFFLFPCFAVNGQNRSSYVDATLGGAKYQGTLALSYVHLWQLGEKRNLGIGFGARFTSYFGANQYYITAPAELTSGSTSPFILFKDNIKANIDTFLISSPQVNSLNLSLNICYKINTKVSVGFNIDAIGFSFGAKRNGNYINGPIGKMSSATPTTFNLLLVSDNDRGSLNSEFYAKYSVNNRWSLKAGAQFLFTEYTTSSKVQTFPQENDRFRNKSLLFCLGISRRIN